MRILNGKRLCCFIVECKMDPAFIYYKATTTIPFRKKKEIL